MIAENERSVALRTDRSRMEQRREREELKKMEEIWTAHDDLLRERFGLF